MKYLVIIPTYNERKNIAEIIPQVLTVSDSNNSDLDILVVDDNSPDKTYDVVKFFSIKDNRVNLLHRMKKEGLGKAYEAGFRWALEKKYDFIISMDADLSHQPKYLQNMLDGDKKIDLLVGSRYIKGGGVIGWDWKRLLNSRGANFATRVMLGIKTHDVTSGFKRYNRKLLNKIVDYGIQSSGYALMVETVYFAKRNNYQIAEFPIVFVDRRAGESKISGELKKSAIVVLKLALERFKNL
ncbi:dolichyl-phosphate beta-D-mannosyltransferase [Candidatus Berkelbacteria bacterium CG_4_8_14_3_um_filter_33_6]|uniref:Dolichyl-phosphate beta-D-mannosyltransferase n=1 Tax=Candidatus Berkelbacteria bacterium CG_4_10_14_0_2_um_filter_35_9_33_12 TaxID=1974499 RepID=A0A2M7W4S3_9BACT|nr:MAG: dolichyl-phosphate beta-D-mannosyltransferase [Candidatus Berkelbacteria bacterium CG_4_8_14_3_um_filter_33_6]PIZ28536.1 MAG: dolichyl-phosphate beta-D-mannosyltransferase [Candidatus Berkelbacteria bacterium CG_4_10_14_0_8_um_filter_35_9_33_8]PJA20893.1 MAG: dolichyl-phosphate beta-D-mannosyltransferase [Candidatus Berkelbacteria bacterium CG_4_10_14_0_2_um_filter_35_9_33_12]